MSFLATGEQSELNFPWMLELDHCGDTGLYEQAMRNKGQEPILNIAPDSSICKSEIHLIAWRHHESANKVDWRFHVWDAYDWPVEDNTLERTNDGKYFQLKQVLDLLDIGTRVDLESAVDKFRTALISHNFPLSTNLDQSLISVINKGRTTANLKAMRCMDCTRVDYNKMYTIRNRLNSH